MRHHTDGWPLSAEALAQAPRTKPVHIGVSTGAMLLLRPAGLQIAPPVEVAAAEFGKPLDGPPRLFRVDFPSLFHRRH